MAFLEVHMVQVREIIRRWQAGENKIAIGRASGVSARTVGRYIAAAIALGGCQGGEAPPEGMLAGLPPAQSRRPSTETRDAGDRAAGRARGAGGPGGCRVGITLAISPGFTAAIDTPTSAGWSAVAHLECVRIAGQISQDILASALARPGPILRIGTDSRTLWEMQVSSDEQVSRVTFSLVVSTINRREQLSRLLASLDRQDCRDFEVIVVDQNETALLDDIIAPYRERFRLTHIRTTTRGVARARNRGLRESTGSVVAFPDDDCWYPDGLLTTIARCFANNPHIDGLCGKQVDHAGQDSGSRWAKRPATVSRGNVWTTSISSVIFFRRQVIHDVGEFDENLGVGSGTKWGSGEETDYIVRALDLGFRLRYAPTFIVHHPQVVTSYDEQSIRRAVSYAMGLGYVLRKQKFSIWDVSYVIVRPLGGAVIALATGRWRKAKYHIAVFTGRITGLKG